jgi:molybdenum cofactor cytidylyltransferase
VASSYEGAPGIPAVFPRKVYGKLHALQGDTGARGLLAKPPCPMIAVPLDGGEVDIDLPADLAKLD